MPSLRARLQHSNSNNLAPPAYELVDRPSHDEKNPKERKRKTSDVSLPSTGDTISEEGRNQENNEFGLPAKKLQSRTKARAIWRIVLVSLFVVFVVVVLSVAIWLLSFLELKPGSYSQFENTQNCDLTTANTSSVEAALSLNIRGSAHLSYAEAKAIDVFWQLFVGAGGRLILAWISYIVFLDGLTRLLESASIPYGLYATMAFQTSSIYSTFWTMKGAVLTRGWRGKAFLAWFAVSSLYVLGFPNLISALGGYVAPSTARFEMPDGNYVGRDSPDLTSCISVTGGQLLGFKQNKSTLIGPPLAEGDFRNESPGIAHPPPELVRKYDLFFQFWNISANTESTRLYPGNRTEPPSSTRVGTGYNHDYYPNSYLNYNLIYNVTFNNHNYTLNDTSPSDLYQSNYCYKNQTLGSTIGYGDEAKCQLSQYFVWGLSSLMLEILLGLQLVWTIGMYAVWLDANINSVLCRNGRALRAPFRAAADLAEAMKEVLGDRTCAYSERELARALSYQSGVRMYSDIPDNDGISHIGLSSVRLKSVEVDNRTTYGLRPGIK